MAVSDRDERLGIIAGALSIGRLERHVFLCAEQTVPRCAGYAETSETWKYLKRRLKELELIDDVLEEPLGGAHRDLESMAERLKARLVEELEQLGRVPVDELVASRYQRLMSYGEFIEK